MMKADLGDGVSSNDPYVAFRRRKEKMRTRQVGRRDWRLGGDWRLEGNWRLGGDWRRDGNWTLDGNWRLDGDWILAVDWE